MSKVEDRRRARAQEAWRRERAARAMRRRRARQTRAKVEAFQAAQGACMNCSSDRLPLHYWRSGIVACGPCLDELRAKYDNRPAAEAG